MTVSMVELPEVRMPVSETVDKIRYKASLEGPRGAVTGIMVIKRMPDSSFRIGYFNEVGMSYLEAGMGGYHPYSMEIRSINPLVSSRNTTHILEIAFNLLLAQKKDIENERMYEDEHSDVWILGKTTGGNQYWGRLDSQNRVDKAFLGTDRNTKAFFDYEDDAYPSHMELMVKNKVMLSLSRK